MAEVARGDTPENVSAEVEEMGSATDFDKEGPRKRVEKMSDNKRKSLKGELYYAFTPELVRERTRCSHACYRFNTAGAVTRRRLVELWRE